MATAVLSGILGAVGDTPLVELASVSQRLGSRVLAKMERFNPGGSIKDRTALSMMLGKLRSGELQPGRSVVVESSSGNLGIGLAQICRYFGLRFVCVVDPLTTERNLAILRAFLADVEVVTERDPETGGYLPARLRRVAELAATVPGSYWPNQYANPLNPEAHLRTMREIDEAVDGQVDYLFASVSTFGTLRGCADYIRAFHLPASLVGVDAVGSAVFGTPPGPRLLPGLGAAVPPALAEPSVADHVVHVDDLDSVVACRRLLRDEAILAGGSSGATVAAVERMADTVPRGSTCVLIFPDGGDRYLDTVYSDEWVAAHFGDVTDRWLDDPAPAVPIADKVNAF